jgi:hypothetical protein
MVETRTTPRSAVASLGCGILVCLIGLALPLVYSHGLHVETTGVSAGLASGCVGLLSLTLGLAAVIFGIVAVRRVPSGRGIAWSGIVLGCLPFAILLIYLIPVAWEELWIRFIPQPIKRGE